MTSRLFDNRQDTTMQVRSAGQGMNSNRRCDKCNQNRNSTGGRQHKRLPIWTCALCLPKQVAA